MEQFNRERNERRLKKRLEKQKQKEGNDSGKENEMPEEKCDEASAETVPVKQVTSQQVNCWYYVWLLDCTILALL